MTTFTNYLAAAAVAFSGLTSTATAAVLTLQDTLGTYNGVTEGFFSSQEVEGRLIVLGDITGSTGQIGFNGPDDGLGLDDLYVFGTVTDSRFSLDAPNSSATVAGQTRGGASITNTTFNMNGGGTLTLAGTRNGGNFNTGTLVENATDLDLPMVDFDSYRSESEALAALPSTALTFADPNNRVFGGTADDDGIAVVTVDISDLASGGYSFDLTGTETLIINVTGATGTFGLNALGDTKSLAESVVWNFADATNVQINTALIGHVVAPKARLSGFGGSTEGTVIASFINLTNGELHQRDFAGTIPGEELVPAVPLPATLPMMIAGLLGLGLLRRKLG